MQYRRAIYVFDKSISVREQTNWDKYRLTHLRTCQVSVQTLNSRGDWEVIEMCFESKFLAHKFVTKVNSKEQDFANLYQCYLAVSEMIEGMECNSLRDVKWDRFIALRDIKEKMRNQFTDDMWYDGEIDSLHVTEMKDFYTEHLPKILAD
jgi:hypothetical protein